MEQVSGRERADDELRRHRQLQMVLADLGLQALRSAELQPLLDEAAVIVARALAVEFASVVEIRPDSDELVIRAGTGWRAGTVGYARVPAGPRSLMAQTVRAQVPFVSESIEEDDRFEPSAVLRSHNVASGATVVIAGRDRPFGGLGAFSTSSHVFSEHDLSFMQSVANVLAAAIERSEIDDRLERVRNSERQRIARDLHDGALRELTETLVLAETAAAAGETAEAFAPALKRISQQLRNAIHNLRLEEPDDRPLGHLLSAVVSLHAPMAGDCDFAIELGEGTPEILLGRSRTEVLRIVGEALTNARRHANAHKIRLRTWLSNGRLFLEISDDGCGFDYDRADGDAGAGLVGLRERADLIDATLTVTSSPGSGTRIEIGVPLRDESEEPQRIRVLLVEDRRSLELLRFAGERRERDLGERDLAAQLTAREREVLQGLADGLDSQAIAERLHISVRTERNHVANILGKLGVHSRLQALVAAVRLGVVSIR